jgi:hypothetical protein
VTGDIILGREERRPTSIYLPGFTDPISKRELFAAMALQGMYSICPPGSTYKADDDFKDEARWLATRATMAADALLEALKEKAQ